MIALSLLFACSGAPDAQGPAVAPERKLVLAAYTTPREAYAEVLPRFAKQWKDKTGETVTFEESYQGSGAQARAVVEGLEADVVALSMEPDIATIEKAGLIAHDWKKAASGGMVTRSIAVIAVRTGNPKGIADWSHLARADVEVLTPNVRTSGGAMWNVLAIWGSKRASPADAEALLAGILGRVSVMDKGARESIVNFEKGVGDAAITYENEVLTAKGAGQAMDYVVPPSTIRIDNPIAVVDTWADKHGNRDLAEAFVAFCASPEAQRVYAAHGLRPVDEAATPAGLPAPADLFTIDDLGGWAAARSALFDKDAAYDRALNQAQTGP